jgi:hypothetical protein
MPRCVVYFEYFEKAPRVMALAHRLKSMPAPMINQYNGSKNISFSSVGSFSHIIRIVSADDPSIQSMSAVIHPGK